MSISSRDSHDFESPGFQGCREKERYLQTSDYNYKISYRVQKVLARHTKVYLSSNSGPL